MDSMDYWQRVVDWDDRSAFEQIFRLHHSYYLLAMVRNHSLNCLCRHRCRNEIELNDVNMERLALHTTPESLMISSEILHRMNAAINDLPPRCKLIFYLVKGKGLKYKEAALLLNVSQRNIENQMGIAFRRLSLVVELAGLLYD